MKKIVLSILVFASASILQAQAPVLNWAKQIGGVSYERVTDIAIDASGNVFSTGYFNGVVDFDPGVGTFTIDAGPVSRNAFISKLDANGNFIWAKSFAPTSIVRSSAITLDAVGNIYIAGTFQGTVDFDPSIATYSVMASSPSDYDGFMSKFDNNGNFIWVKTISGLYDQIESTDLKIDVFGNIIICGYFNINVDFDPSPATYTLSTLASSRDAFILKLDAGGNFIWAKNIGGNGSDEARALTSDASGNIYTIGRYEYTADFDPSISSYTINSVGNTDVFVSKLDVNGNFVWAKSFGGTSFDFGFSISLDATNNVYTGGGYRNTVDFDPGVGTFSATSTGGLDAYISKLDVNGNFLWANVFGSSGSDATTSLITDFSNNIIATGFFSGLTDFDSSPASYTLAPSAIDVFILQNNSTGNLGWVHQLASNDYVESTAIVVDNSNNIYTSGLFQGTVDFDPNAGILNIPSFGVEDGFINKMSPCLAPVMPNNITPITNLNICENSTTILSVTSAGSVNWYSSPASTLAIGSGTSFVTPTLAAGTYTFYAEATTCTISLTRLAITVSVTACTGINETQNRNIISVYPNPTNNNVTIELSNYTKQTTVEIINTVGEVVLKSNVTSPKNLIITDNLTSGIYFIKMENNIFKFIKY